MVSDQIALKSDSVDIVLNRRWPDKDFKSLYAMAEEVTGELELEGHVWLATSGSTAERISGIKLVAIAKTALLASAWAVNEHLNATSEDIWAQVLPHFHVGGIGIAARALLSEAKVITGLDSDFKWVPAHFVETVRNNSCTLTALVPTQIYDLVQAGLFSPPSLRAVIVGGGAISHELYFQARRLGWPLLPSYGMTETASQIATAPLSSLQSPDFPPVTFLSHVQARIDYEGYLEVKCGSLLTCYAQSIEGSNRYWDPKLDGWFRAEDKAVIHENQLSILGRSQDYVKIGGELVLLSRLREKLEQVILAHAPSALPSFALAAVPAARLGHEIHLFFESHVAAEAVQRVQRVYDEAVLPFEKLRGTHSVVTIPRTDLGKIRYSDLKIG